MSVPSSLEQVFKVSFTKKDSIEELQEYHTPNAYCLDAAGKLLGLTSCENDYTSLTIPAEWEHLEYLDISDNAQLGSLTFEAALPNLNYLDVSDSQLKELHLPAGFDALDWLDASRNALEAVTFGGLLPQLTYMDVSGNQLERFTLPGGFAALQYLYLNDNVLAALIFEDAAPSALQILHLRNNKLEALPPQLFVAGAAGNAVFARQSVVGLT